MGQLVTPAKPSTDVWKQHVILIIDDEPQILAELKTLLELEGFKVVTGLSGEEGLRCLRKYPVKLVIADQKMPKGMSGTVFLSKVKAQYPDMLTMILSAFSEPAYLMDAVNEAGVFRYLLKPWKQDDLIASVSEALRQYHNQQEQRQESQAMTKRALQESFTFIGELSGELYNDLFPLLESSYLTKDQDGNKLSTGVFLSRLELTQAVLIINKLGYLWRQYQATCNFQRARVVDLVQVCVRRAEIAAQQAAIELVCAEEYGSGIPLLWLQPAAFISAVQALIENAILYNPQPEGVNPRQLQVRVYCDRQREPVVRIEIQDNGPGFADSKKSLFSLGAICIPRSAQLVDNRVDSYYNLSTVNHHGLGLTLARWSIVQHDGVLELVNPGKPGALMRIEVPVKQAGLRHRVKKKKVAAKT